MGQTELFTIVFDNDTNTMFAMEPGTQRVLAEIPVDYAADPNQFIEGMRQAAELAIRALDSMYS